MDNIRFQGPEVLYTYVHARTMYVRVHVRMCITLQNVRSISEVVANIFATDRKKSRNLNTDSESALKPQYMYLDYLKH